MSDSEFFGRTGEIETLQNAYESPTAEIAIIYGRRRIGKTALIRKFCEKKAGIFLYGESLEGRLSARSVFAGCRSIQPQSPTAIPRLAGGLASTDRSPLQFSQGHRH